MMLELQQVSAIGNPRRPYYWNSSSRKKSKVSGVAEDGSSGIQTSSRSTTRFRCNNCNVEAPINDLRVRESELAQLNYHHRSERPVLYHEMLLCDSCKIRWREWTTDNGKYYERSQRSPHSGPPSRNELERYSLIPLVNWSQAYWRNKFATENSPVSLPRRQVPPCAEACQASATPQGLR